MALQAKKKATKKSREDNRQQKNGNKIRARSGSPAKPSIFIPPIKPNSIRISLMWTTIFCALVGALYVLSVLSDQSPLLLGGAVFMGSMMMPMQLLLCGNALFLSQTPAIPHFLLWTSMLGISLAFSLLLGARFAPLFLVRLATGVSSLSNRILHGFVFQFVPQKVLAIGGIGFTIISELLLIPAVIGLLLGVAQLRYAGEDFNRRHRPHPKPSSSSSRPVLIIFIHGNRFNESQWLFGRLCLLARPYSDQVDFLSVNIFGGPLMRNHSKHTESIQLSATRAMEQIDAQMKQQKLNPKHVILIGHSLGGVISAYIKEHFAAERKLPVERVIAWSAPFVGSHLLFWAKQNISWHGRIVETMTYEFCPTNPVTIDLHARMAKTDAQKPTYFGITGWCDPLCRPDSALPRFFRPGHTKLIPYLGHYNIKISLNAWRHVVGFVDDFMNKLEDNI